VPDGPARVLLTLSIATPVTILKTSTTSASKAQLGRLPESSHATRRAGDSMPDRSPARRAVPAGLFLSGFDPALDLLAFVR